MDEKYPKPDIIIIEEAAYVKNPKIVEEAEKLLKRKNGGDNKLILISTFNPNFEDDKVFQPLFIESQEGKNDFKTISLTWKDGVRRNDGTYPSKICEGLCYDDALVTTELNCLPVTIR